MRKAFQAATARASALAGSIPLPAAIKRHVSKKDLAFIAAAYAIPLPGTGLFAATLVGGKLGYRHLRNQLGA